MRLMTDWIMPYQGILDARCGTTARCRVRVYADEHGDKDMEPVVLMTELADGNGESLASSAGVVAATVLMILVNYVDFNRSPGPLFFLHRPPGVGHPRDIYERASFAGLEVRGTLVEQAQNGGSGHTLVRSLGEAEFHRVDRRMVGTLLHRELPEP